MTKATYYQCNNNKHNKSASNTNTNTCSVTKQFVFWVRAFKNWEGGRPVRGWHLSKTYMWIIHWCAISDVGQRQFRTPLFGLREAKLDRNLLFALLKIVLKMYDIYPEKNFFLWPVTNRKTLFLVVQFSSQTNIFVFFCYHTNIPVFFSAISVFFSSAPNLHVLVLRVPYALIDKFYVIVCVRVCIGILYVIGFLIILGVFLYASIRWASTNQLRVFSKSFGIQSPNSFLFLLWRLVNAYACA